MLSKSVLAAVVFLWAGILAGAERLPVLVDTDIGSRVEDAFALGLVLASPELELVGVTTVGQPTDDRAWFACRFITQCERAGIPVAAGQEPQPAGSLDWQIQYRRHPAALFNRTLQPASQPAVAVMRDALASRQEKQVTVLALGPLTNVGRLLKEHPETGKWIKEIIAVEAGADADAARHVLASQAPLVVIPAEAAKQCVLGESHRERLFESCRPLAFQVHNLYELHGEERPRLGDPLAAAAALRHSSIRLADARASVEDDGRFTIGAGAATCRRVEVLSAEALVDWLTDRLAADGKVTLPRPDSNPSELIPPDNFPRRVHAFEDYETDIERRWWMSGKLETSDTPPGRGRACRATLTEDFDDRQGDTKTMYRAVIFNPVPGPPMGPLSRLSFRYKLEGSSSLRVQLYSLTNGYHRCLSLADLAQGEWSQATVDMTALRRPDGSGGPLSADERIDDIQYYVDPRATLLIDDIVLYEAPPANESRPFPRRILFTGWFDTGKQGEEWPGEFQIVSHAKPRTWKHAQSVSAANGSAWLRIGLRGPRRLDEITELAFQYRLTGVDRLRVELYSDDKPLGLSADLAGLPREEWESGQCRFTIPGGDKPVYADEIRIVAPSGGDVAIDDLLFYVPGEDLP